MKFLFLFAAFMAMSASACAQEAPPADPNLMRHCQSFADCTLVWNGCSDDAINKAFLNQFQPSVSCQKSIAHDPKAVPTCTDGLCVAVSPKGKQ